MSAVAVQTPLAPVFSEEAAQTTLTKHFDNAELIPLLLEFCSPDLGISEHQLLLDNPNLVTTEAVNAIRQVALRANAVSAFETAYFFHRKAEVLNACVEQGVSEFFLSLNDPAVAMDFFDRVGPPPGYEDDYWSHLVDSYKEGDHLQHQIRRQVYQSQDLGEYGDLEFHASETDVSLLGDLKKLLSQKYGSGQPDFTAHSEEMPKVLAALQSQINERQMLIQEFLNTGLPLLLNWMLSLTPSARFGLLEQCIADVVLTSSLDTILSARQRRQLLPELSDLPMLVGDGVEHLQQLLVRIAAGQENQWAGDGSVPFIDESHTTFIERLSQALPSDKPLILGEMDLWARAQAQEHWFNVPALLRLEFAVETALWTFGATTDLPPNMPRKTLQFESFTIPFALYRTRGLQLFALSLIEKCLKTCLPAAPPVQNKKRKRPM